MSKPVLAFVAMQLVQERLLDLDRPLVDYLGHDYLPGQPDHRRITARMALTHRTGFVNWRTGYDEMGGPAIAVPAGVGLHVFGRRHPVPARAMERSSESRSTGWRGAPVRAARPRPHEFVWTEALEADLASGHHEDGTYKDRTRYRKPNAAYSLYTTPSEYARLMLTLQHPELLGARALTKASIDHAAAELRVDDGDAIPRPGLARSVATIAQWAGAWRSRRKATLSSTPDRTVRLPVVRPVQPRKGLGPRHIRQRRGRFPPARDGDRENRGPLRPTPPAGTTRSRGR